MSRNIMRLVTQSEGPAAAAEDIFKKAMDTLHGPRRALFVRHLREVARLVSQLDDEKVTSALSEETGRDSLVASVAGDGSVDDSPLTQAFLRGITAKRRILDAEGGSLTGQELQDTLGISRQHIHSQRENGKLIAVQLANRIYRYPVWQFDASGRPLAGLEEVLKALPSDDEWGRLIFFIEPNELLGRSGREENPSTPIAALRAGRTEDVIRAARAWSA